jgi:hypothetical protein
MGAGFRYYQSAKSLTTPTYCSVQPRLVTSAVWEPTVGTADGDIEDKVERY